MFTNGTAARPPAILLSGVLHPPNPSALKCFPKYHPGAKPVTPPPPPLPSPTVPSLPPRALCTGGCEGWGSGTPPPQSSHRTLPQSSRVQGNKKGSSQSLIRSRFVAYPDSLPRPPRCIHSLRGSSVGPLSICFVSMLVGNRYTDRLHSALNSHHACHLIFSFNSFSIHFMSKAAIFAYIFQRL